MNFRELATTFIGAGTPFGLFLGLIFGFPIWRAVGRGGWNGHRSLVRGDNDPFRVSNV